MSMDVISTVKCSKCDRSLGELSIEEFNAVFADKTGFRLCFDCDPESALTVPSFFWQWKENELFDIGDVAFQIRDQKLKVIGHSHERAHEQERARGLSSYTKLNRITKNKVLLGNGIEQQLCPACHGDSVLWDSSWGLNCDRCDGLGVIESAIVLPGWILGLAVENV